MSTTEYWAVNVESADNKECEYLFVVGIKNFSPEHHAVRTPIFHKAAEEAWKACNQEWADIEYGIPDMYINHWIQVGAPYSEPGLGEYFEYDVKELLLNQRLTGKYFPEPVTFFPPAPADTAD